MVTTFFLEQILFFLLTFPRCGVMAELVDAVDSKSAEGNLLWVRFPLALEKRQVLIEFRICLFILQIITTQ